MSDSSAPQDGHSRRGITVDSNAVRRARRQAGLTLKELAEPELSRGSIWLIEQGRSRPSIRTLRHIAERTGKSISYFLPAGGALTADQSAALVRLQQLVDADDFTEAIRFGANLLRHEDLPDHVEVQVRLLLGRAYVRTGEGQYAEEHLTRARAMCQFLNDPFILSEVLDQLACAMFLNDDPRMLKLGWEALSTAEQLAKGSAKLLVPILLHLGSFLLAVRDWARAAHCYERALRLSTDASDNRHLAMLHDQLSIAYQWLGNPDQTAEHARQAQCFYERCTDPADHARAANNMGWLRMKQEDFEAAAQQFARALEICEEHSVDRQGFAHVTILLNLAEAHIALGLFDSAEPELDEALRVATSRSQARQQASGLRLLGRLRSEQADFRSAIKLFEQSAEIYAKRDLLGDMAEVLHEKGAALMAQGRVLEAAECWKLSAASALEAVRRIRSGGGQDLVG